MITQETPGATIALRFCVHWLVVTNLPRKDDQPDRLRETWIAEDSIKAVRVRNGTIGGQACAAGCSWVEIDGAIRVSGAIAEMDLIKLQAWLGVTVGEAPRERA